MSLSQPSAVFFGVAAFGLIIVLVEVFALWLIRRRRVDPPKRFPSVSLLKPLCGLDDELRVNLETHLALDYPGPVEILLGVRNEQDAAYPLARELAETYPDRVRLVLQQGEPGHNPKVNQLITLTRASRYEVVVVTDSNVRVPPHYLRELMACLEKPDVGLASNLFIGAGEWKLGAILDNMTLISFCAPNLALGDLVLPNDQVVGKSLAIRRQTLEMLGGWHEFKDVLAEDQVMGRALRDFGLHSMLAASPVINFQREAPFSSFWKRHTRWSMMRFRVLLPGVLLEPLLNPFLWAIAGVAVAPTSPLAWISALGVALGSAALTQVAAVISRGYGFRWYHLLLVPVRDVAFFLTWLRGATLRGVEWRGNKLLVLARSRLAEPHALVRVKNMQRSRG